MSKKRAFSLLLVLVFLAMALSGCAPVKEADGNLSAPGWIAWLSDPLALIIQFMHDLLARVNLASYGLTIILVTVLIRLLIYPLTKKQMESMKKMQDVQPKMKELQEKYGSDRSKLAEKQMELYRQEGVNPAGGCLPLLIQMPILFAFYYALLTLGPKLDERFLWLPSLAFPRYFEGMSWLTPLTPQHLLSAQVLPYLLLPVLYVLSQIVMQRMSQNANASALPGSTNTMMMMMPLMFGYITLLVPSGLTLYWVTSNVLQIIQQGLTTGWSGLLPGRKPVPEATDTGLSKSSIKPASTTGGNKEATSVTVTSTTSRPSVQPQTPDGLSAGRRRKMRKKKS
ncbi:MAG: YidC/Oxa1 family membrane protein insertase [Caldilineales bacterium]